MIDGNGRTMPPKQWTFNKLPPEIAVAWSFEFYRHLYIRSPRNNIIGLQ